MLRSFRRAARLGRLLVKADATGWALTAGFEVPARRPAKYLGSGDEGAYLVSCRTQDKGARSHAGGGLKGWKRRRNDLPDCPAMPSGCA